MTDIVKNFYKAKASGDPDAFLKACSAATQAGYLVHDNHISETHLSMKQPKPAADFMKEKPTSDGTTFAKAQAAEAKAKKLGVA